MTTNERPSWQRGNWMQTFTGRQFYPLDPRPEDISILDIAHALSMQCRYNGHVRNLYSVAEHCVLVSRLVAPENALWALLHDATEAYVGDMIPPLKLHMPEFQAVENKVMRAIAQKFGLAGDMPNEVHETDSRILLDERAALMGPPAGEWDIEGEPFGVEILAWSPATAELEYLVRFAELTGDPVDLPVGLCPDRASHEPHVHHCASLGTFWRSADQKTRLPWAAERRQRDAKKPEAKRYGPRTVPSEYRVLPTGYSASSASPEDKGLFELRVCWRGADPETDAERWAVVDRRGSYLAVDGTWSYGGEPRPSSRDDDWLARYRFDRETALRLATEAVDAITFNGLNLARWDAENVRPTALSKETN